jgi:hypothetical protein
MTKRPFPDMEAANFIGKHSVAFLLPEQAAPGGAELKASGSLVTFDQRHFVLTATHVWARLQKSPTIHFSAIADISHSVAVPREALSAYSLDDALEDAFKAGKEVEKFDADLTLLELHPADYHKMLIRSSFYLLEREPDAQMNDWVIIGAPGVLAARDPKEVNTLSFEIRAIFVEDLKQEAEHGGMDFLSALPYQDSSSPIRDYRGMSGGGLWSVSYYPEKLAESRYNVFLIGVIFFQNDKEIRCLGRKAVKQLVQKVRQHPKASPPWNSPPNKQ